VPPPQQLTMPSATGMQELPRPLPAFRSTFVMGRQVPGKGGQAHGGDQLPEVPVAQPSPQEGAPDTVVSRNDGLAAFLPVGYTRANTGEAVETRQSIVLAAAPVVPAPAQVVGAAGADARPGSGTTSTPVEGLRRDETARQRVEDALESFFGLLPAWRGGQRDVGRASRSESIERGDADAASRSASRRKWRKEKERRSRSRRRPSPVPVPSRRGSMFDVGPQKALADAPAPVPVEKKEKKEKKDKDRDERRGSRSASLGRPTKGGRKEREAERAGRRSASRPKKKEAVEKENHSPRRGRKRKEADADSRSPSRAKRKRSE